MVILTHSCDRYQLPDSYSQVESQATLIKKGEHEGSALDVFAFGREVCGVGREHDVPGLGTRAERT